MSTRAPRFGLLIAAPLLAVVLAAEIAWIFDHPYGIHWDEAAYIDQVSVDARALRSGDPRTIAREIVSSDRGRPPAYRFVGTPAMVAFGTPAACRLLSLSLFGVAVVLLYRTVALLAGPGAAAFSALFLCLCPDVVAATVFFGTEPPLYLATMAMLWILVRCWSVGSERTIDWIGLGLALALGFLAKTSFFAIAPPVLALALFARPLGLARGPRARWLFAAGALGGAIAAPWWAMNLSSAAEFGAGARGFLRHSLGSPSLQTFGHWASAVARGSIGPAQTVLALLVVLAFVAKRWRSPDRPLLTPVQRIALLACACAGLPIVLIQLSGTNHLLRHISPALIPLSLGMGVLADASGWIDETATAGIAAAAFAIQAAMIAYPVVRPNAQFVDTGLVTGTLPWRALIRFDQWDWDALRELAREHGFQHPSVSYLGLGRTFNTSSIEYPWLSRGEDVDRATLLWRYEQGPLDWSDVLERAANSDLVVTAPRYVGDPLDKQDLDNAHNAEFAARLEADKRFSGPIMLTMGRFEPVEVEVFVRTHGEEPAGRHSASTDAG